MSKQEKGYSECTICGLQTIPIMKCTCPQRRPDGSWIYENAKATPPSEQQEWNITKGSGNSELPIISKQQPITIDGIEIVKGETINLDVEELFGEKFDDTTGGTYKVTEQGDSTKPFVLTREQQPMDWEKDFDEFFSEDESCFRDEIKDFIKNLLSTQRKEMIEEAIEKVEDIYVDYYGGGQLEKIDVIASLRELGRTKAK